MLLRFLLPQTHDSTIPTLQNSKSVKHRLLRVNELMKRELSALITREMDFEPALVTVSSVDVTPDLKKAHVFVSVLGPVAKKPTSWRNWKRIESFCRPTWPKQWCSNTRLTLSFIWTTRLSEAPAFLRFYRSSKNRSPVRAKFAAWRKPASR